MSRYVTVKRKWRDLGPDDFGAIRRRPWSRWKCVCGVIGGKYDHGEAVTSADRHARRCPTVRIVTERDNYAEALDAVEQRAMSLQAALKAVMEATC